MARVKGVAGRYAIEQVSRKVVFICVSLCVGEFVLGLLVGAVWFSRKSMAGIIALLAVTIAVTTLGGWFFRRRERELRSWQKGRDGEILVGQALALDLPRPFYVIHDLKTDFGNLDHVVIGPTGVFAIETKNWRGTVTADGQGELLLNGKPTNKPFVRQFTRTIMGIREQWTVLAKTDRFIHGVMVFPVAYENADWGKTGNVHCIGIDRIPGYFLEQKPSKPLSSAEMKTLTRAFLALARMDEGFDGPGTVSDRTAPPSAALEGQRSDKATRDVR